MTKQITPDVIDNQAEGSAQTAVDIWQSILDKFKSELSESVFTKWIQGLEFVAGGQPHVTAVVVHAADG